MNLIELAAQLTAGETTSEKLTETALQHATRPEGEGARVFIELHADQAMADARVADIRRSNGHVMSLLDGVPVTVKDLFDVVGQVTRAGSKVLAGNPPAIRDATVVTQLKAAGAVILGRTNMTEFAYSGLGVNPHFGSPGNPWDRSRIPGGSSSGAAVAVADGMGFVAIGSDTGGSLRIPAALCGVVGFKPTAGRISGEGAVPLAMSLDSVGPIANNVLDCAVTYALLAGHAVDKFEAKSLKNLKLAIPQTYVLDDLDSDVAREFAATVALFKEAGAKVIEVALPEFAEYESFSARGSLVNFEAYTWHKSLLESKGDCYDPRVRSRLLAEPRLSMVDYIQLRSARESWISRVRTVTEAYDALLWPTTRCIAPLIREVVCDDAAYAAINARLLANTAIVNFLDGCAISVPCHLPGQAPVGIMLVGQRKGDLALLQIAMGAEEVLRKAGRGLEPLQGSSSD